MAFEDRKYVIIPISEIDSVDFNEVMQTSKESIRKSLDGTLALLKYEGEQPDSLADITGKSQEYTHAEIIELMSTSAWYEEINNENIPSEG